MKRLLLTCSIIATVAITAFTQVTTSSITGVVRDNEGEPMIGATVKATHIPSGTVYGVVTQSNGRYTIPNMRVGGPYTIEASFVGFKVEPYTEAFLALGVRSTFNFEMEEGVLGEEVIITGVLDPTFNTERTGAETAISRDLLDNLPTISRAASDYTRLNTMAAEGGSFAGRNDQYNNYSLDGTIFNNPFGLDAATPGGQTNAQPVSLDAIQEISVSIAPFDVTQSGFTGASINAVTKSGTNEFQGTVFGFFRNKALTGGTVAGEDVFKGDPKQLQAGFSLGGPIKKDKVFFFANFELEERSDLGSFFVPSGSRASAGNVSRVSAADMQLVSDLLRSRYGYDTGAIEGFEHQADNMKGLLKFDFNLSQRHKLTTTYNFLDAYRDLPAHPSAIGRRGPDFLTLQFENTGYRIHNVIHSGIAELKSFFGDKFSNKLQIGYTAFRDSRDPKSAPFPVINIGKGGTRYIIAGHEPFSIHNRLDQDAFQFTNDLTMFAGNHTWTFGTSFERFDFDNSFNLGVYGGRVFAPDIPMEEFQSFVENGGLDDAVDAAVNTFNANGGDDGVEGEGWALAETNLGQWAFYIQDEVAVNENLNLTFGLRMDVPLFFNTADKIQENIDRQCCYDPSIVYTDEDLNDVTYDHTTLPTGNVLFNPRFGFNYDFYGDQRLQLRGGTGLFSGRFPFVWIGNQVANPNFFFYNMTDPDFKFPQVWRTNLGYDRKFGDGWIATMDLVYTKDIQSHMVRNYGLKLPGGNLNGPDSRPFYRTEDRVLVFGAPTNAYVFTNSSGGYSFNASFEISRSWNNTYIKLGYNYLDAKDVSSLEAEISSDAYDRNPANVIRTNREEVAPSLYGNRHRFIGAATKRLEIFGEKAPTTISLFFEYVEGTRYAYTYSGDVNNDGSGLNDLIYIPTDAEIDNMNFTGNALLQRSALKAYIAQDDYLSSRRGHYAEKYGAISPWYNTWDLRILQDYMLNNGHKIQLSLDILNLGNLVNSGWIGNGWGTRRFATQTSLAQPLAVSVDGDGNPTYTFDTNQRNTFFNDFSVASRWRMQFGLRYTF